MITRRKFIAQSGLLTSALAISGTVMSFSALNKGIENQTFDVIIIGGSYAGLSAAMALGRSLRKVLLIDSGLPCNRQAPHAHNFITQDGEMPKNIANKAKTQVLNYETVTFHEDIAIQVRRSGDTFELMTQLGKTFSTKKMLFATGLKDIMPPIPGFSDCWAKSILHCPYCHGYEVKNQETGILGNSNLAFHYAQLVSNLTDKLTIFTNGKSVFSAEQYQLIQRNKIRIIEQEVLAIEHHNGQLSSILLKDGSVNQLKALYARPSVEQHCKIPIELSCELTDQGLLKLDNFQQTTVPGIYACGDNSAFRSIATAVSSGSQAGATINMALSTEIFNFK
ncbi:NAD(P)/FAD-dependent oxidoreductase [Sphingobacterium sp. SRCM116780]|uniref:NAD(P)/FAD-dependent oxidoreductase n=1 Tax=Sphingobacterium sp. SRCM116780 TaxID=2907623 RepID=UPI001F1D787E|nr:NAD(P)/FAD-dependent oxidoreductase [Sphingobacterium sp. SRCM116780]UIR54922.1 NAD(P)/FAD-dependent oxidoreductase [Sphingobacterium sp. SRCM116780]